MNKKLTARVQKLNPAAKEHENSFSFGVVIEPGSKELALSKGNIYAVFDVSSENSFDTDVVSKVIHDVLSDNYYNVDSVSPIHSIEKALSIVKDNILELQQNASIVDASVDFNALVSVLWGNVFYVVQYGKGSGYLMRLNEVKSIQTSGEGNFSFSSGIVKEDDVVILCTNGFVKKFPPEVLLTKSISGKDLDNRDSCLLLKFIVDTSFTESDLKEMANIAAQKKPGVESILENVVTKLQTFNPSHVTPAALIAAKPKIMDKPSVVFNKKNLIILIALVAVIGIAFGVFSLFNTTSINFSEWFKPKKKEEPVVAVVPDEIKVSNTAPAVQTEDLSKDKELGITRVTVKNTLFDLVISDATIKPTGLDLYENKLLVSDSNSGKVYTSVLGDYKFLPIEETFPGMTNTVVSKEGELVFSYDGKISVYSIPNLSVLSTYATKANWGIGLFGSFIYSFDDTKLVRYSKKEGNLVPTTWAESSEFVGNKGIQIAYSIFVATKDNNVVKYTTGKKEDFEISGLETPIGNISDFAVKEDFKNIYIADSVNKRVVVINSKGEFVKQYRYTDQEGWKDIKAIAIDDKESKLYVLSGTKIFEIAL